MTGLDDPSTIRQRQRWLRLLFENYPRSHILVLLGQPPLVQSLALSVNEEVPALVVRLRPERGYSSTIYDLSAVLRSKSLRSQFGQSATPKKFVTPTALNVA